MRTRLGPVIWLTLVWVGFWGSLTAANVIGGLVLAAVLVQRVPPRSTGTILGIRPLAAIRLFVFFSWKLVEASIVVAWEVVTPKNRINPAVISVALESSSDAVLTAVANMVSLTPGTVTVDVDRETRTLLIHVLHFHDSSSVTESVEVLERYAAAALGDRSGTQADPSEMS